MSEQTIGQLLEQAPFVADFFEQNRLDIRGFEAMTFREFLACIDESTAEELALNLAALPLELERYVEQMQAFLGLEEKQAVTSLSILPGRDKSGAAERFTRLDILPSQIISIVGPTGSGKSRLLADIEWAAQGDTPTGRSVLINGAKPDPKWRMSANHKLVAQLSQNMNFVIDLSVGDFLQMHAESRMIAQAADCVARILQAANELAGEPFSKETPVTSLSGGQSRALMIADTAILSSSPIVLIDEIENAGIDRERALSLLLSQEKIVLMATHDPLLALMADRRIVIGNGGIQAVLETSEQERTLRGQLAEMDALFQQTRRGLRAGERLQSL